MKSIITLLFIFFITEGHSQFFDPFKSNSFAEGKIYLNYGDTLEGFIKTRQREVVFKFRDDGLTSKIEIEDIDKIIYGDRVYKYKKVDGKKYKVFSINKSGTINIFIERNDVYINNGSGTTIKADTPDIRYYIGKKGSETMFYLSHGNSYSNRFLKIAKNLFSDCPDVINKIENKHFDRFDIPGIVEYYSKECAE